MTAGVTCPKCSRSLRVKIENAGKKARCGCGEVFQLPISFDSGLLDDPEIVGIPGPVIPKEPWFYGWLARLAGFLWGFAKVSTFACLVATIIAGMVVGVTAPDPIPALAMALLRFAIPAAAVALSLAWTFAGSALVLLAVDAARNVRESRYR